MQPDIIQQTNMILREMPEGAIDTGDGFIVVDKQVQAIKAITARLNWKRKSLFSFILRYFPEYRDRLKAEELKTFKVSALYQLMNKKEKSNIISRLDAIQNRNKAKHGVKKCRVLYRKQH